MFNTHDHMNNKLIDDKKHRFEYYILYRKNLKKFIWPESWIQIKMKWIRNAGQNLEVQLRDADFHDKVAPVTSDSMKRYLRFGLL